MTADFDKKDWPPHRCRVDVREGMIFICLAAEGEEAADLDTTMETLLSYCEHYDLANAKVIHKENFREFYHCAPAHPEYTRVNAYVNDGNRRSGPRWSTHGPGSGRPRASRPAASASWGDQLEAVQPCGAFRQPIRDGFFTLSQDGQPVTP